MTAAVRKFQQRHVKFDKWQNLTVVFNLIFETPTNMKILSSLPQAWDSEASPELHQHWRLIGCLNSKWAKQKSRFLKATRLWKSYDKQQVLFLQGKKWVVQDSSGAGEITVDSRRQPLSDVCGRMEFCGHKVFFTKVNNISQMTQQQSQTLTSNTGHPDAECTGGHTVLKTCAQTWCSSYTKCD